LPVDKKNDEMLSAKKRVPHSQTINNLAAETAMYVV